MGTPQRQTRRSRKWGFSRLSTYRSTPMAELTDAEWELWKTAVAEYSMYRPYLQYEAYVPVPSSIEQVPPTGALGIESIAYGVAFTLAEVMAAPEGEQGWCLVN